MSQDDNTKEIINIATGEQVQQAKISFGFSKIIPKSTTTAASVAAAEKKRKEPEQNHDYITELQGTNFTSANPKFTKGPKVIPLYEQLNTTIVNDNNNKNNNNNNNNNNSNNKTNTTNTTSIEPIIESPSKKSKLEETESFYKANKTGLQVNPNKQQKIKSIVDNDKVTTATTTGTTSVPLILKLKGIDEIKDENEKFKYDLDSRPEEATEEDYEETPIEVIGEAMLRGMGWTPGKGIGRSNQGLIEPVEFVRRPGFRLGLGAKPKDDDIPPTSKKGSNSDSNNKNNNNIITSSKYGLKQGMLVGVISGPHIGMKAEIKSLEPNDKAIILFKSNEEVIINQSDLEILDIKSSPNNNNNISNNKSNNSSSKASSNSSYNSSSSSSKTSSSSSSSSNNNNEEMWIKPWFLVKIISKSLSNGKYYNKKATVVDITGDKTCTLELDNGTVIENVKQRMLETVIPRSSGAFISIVRGKYKGKFAVFMDRKLSSRDKEYAVVQLHGEHQILELDLDDICQIIENKFMDLY